jgi:integrase
MSVAPPSSIVLHLGEENASPLSLAPPLPLERLSVPDELNGRTGSNRAGPEVVCQLAASDDLEAVQAWLGEFHDSPQTLRAYRKEAERLLLWALLERGKPLSSLTREDCILYEVFLADPQPRQRWCGQKAPRFSPRWRPFLGPLSPASRRLAMLIINSLFSYLVKAGYLAGNPLALTRRRGRYQAQRQVERFLEHDQWQVLLDTVEALPRDSEQEQRHYARTRFLVALLYLLGPRVSEVAGHAMSSFIQIRGRWWWRVTGKGQKEAQVPVNQDMLQALRDYRKFYGLPSLPAPDETTPAGAESQGYCGHRRQYDLQNHQGFSRKGGGANGNRRPASSRETAPRLNPLVPPHQHHPSSGCGHHSAVFTAQCPSRQTGHYGPVSAHRRSGMA